MAKVDRVIVFDLDDTLYLERDYAASGFAAVARWIARELGHAGFDRCAMRAFAAGVRGTVFDTALREMGIAAERDLIARLVAVYRRHPPIIRLAEDAHRFIRGCPRHVAMALLTDGFLEAQQRKIDALGLAGGLLNPIICTDRWGRADWKPSRRGFLHIQAHFGLPGAAFTYIADNPAKDFVAPRELGWRTVQICRPGGLYGGHACAAGGEPHARIASLTELGYT